MAISTSVILLSRRLWAGGRCDRGTSHAAITFSALEFRVSSLLVTNKLLYQKDIKNEPNTSLHL